MERTSHILEFPIPAFSERVFGPNPCSWQLPSTNRVYHVLALFWTQGPDISVGRTQGHGISVGINRAAISCLYVRKPYLSREKTTKWWVEVLHIDSAYLCRIAWRSSVPYCTHVFRLHHNQWTRADILPLQIAILSRLTTDKSTTSHTHQVQYTLNNIG